jgi:hypothetical protein
MPHAGNAQTRKNPFDALLVPPALIKRALDDLHDIADLARRYTEIEEEIDARVARIERDIAAMRAGVDGLRAALAPISQLEPIRASSRSSRA